MPNGDVPAQVIPKQGKFRRFLLAVCRFFGYMFCCRCCKCLPCCKGKSKEKKIKEPSIDKTNSSNGCCCPINPFKCLTCCKRNRCCSKKQQQQPKRKNSIDIKSKRKCCAKPICNCQNCCLVFRDKINSFCRCLFCLNLTCCQNILKKCKCCHKFQCCQSNGFCSCCNPYAKTDPKKLMKLDSRTSNTSRVSL